MAKDRELNLVKSHVIFKDYSKDAERTALLSGENLAHAFGKIARWYTDISWVGHTHTEASITDLGTYAGASTKGGAATSANKLNIGSTDIGSETKPVYFNATTGKPVACAYSLNASVPANAVFTDTTYTFTTTGVNNGQIKVTPAGGTASTYTVYTHPSGTAKTQGLYKFAVDDYGHVTNASTVTGSDLPAHTHAYLPLAGGTMTGDIVFAGITSTEYPAVSNQIYFSGSTDWAKIYYRVDASDAGRLVFDIGDDSNTRIDFAYNGSTKSYIDIAGNFSGTSNATNYPNITAGNEIRFNVNSKPANAIDLHIGYAWSGGTKDAKINRYVFMNGNTTLTNVKAALFEGKSTSSAYTNYDDIIAIQTGSSKQAKITLETLINWLINTKKVLPATTLVHKIIQTTWAYANNDLLQISCNGRSYEIQLAGVVLEFIGSVTSYNYGEFRLFIHTSPTTDGTASSGYVLAPTSTTFVYTCNGSGYSPTWKMITNAFKYANGYWGLTDPNGSDSDWTRTTSNGIIPYQGGSLGSGHQSLGTSSWYFSHAYADQLHGYSLGLGSSSIQGRITIQSPTTASVAYNSTNPRIRFCNASNDQNIDIVMCDFDSVRGPAALSVHGNQGGEYLLAPRISAWDYTNNKTMAQLAAWSLGTTSAVGEGRVIAGNGTVKGTAGNAKGIIEIYSEQAGCVFLVSPSSVSSSYTVTLPPSAGSMTAIVYKSTTDYIANTQDGVNSAINKLSTGSADPVDADYYISQYAGGGTATTSYHRRPVSTMWNYINGKAASVYAKLSGAAFTGNISLAETKAILLRPSHSSYTAGIGYDTSGNECIAIWAKNTVTRLRWYAGTDMTTMTSGTMMGITPDFEISKASGTAKGYIGGDSIVTVKILWSGTTSCTARSTTDITLTTTISANKYRTIKVVFNVGSTFTGVCEFRADTLNVTNNIPTSSGATEMNIVQFKISSDGKKVSVGPGTAAITVLQIIGVCVI